MTRLTEKKRKWVINQFNNGKSATSIARIQRMSRRYVYKLVSKFEEEGILAYKAKIPGRSKQPLNVSFVKKVVELRNKTDYGSEKIHFVTKREGFNVSQRQIQRILNEFGLTDIVQNVADKEAMFVLNGQSAITCGIATGHGTMANGTLLLSTIKVVE